MVEFKTGYKDPEVRLIRKMDSLAEAWQVSRPYLSLYEAKDQIHKQLEGIDLPLNGMKQYHLTITSSLFFRDLLFTLRPLNSAWAETLRARRYAPDNMFISSEFRGNKNEDVIQDNLNKCYERIANGEKPDVVKEELPMATSTNFSISVDDRTLITWLRTLRNHSIDTYNTYAPLFLEAIGRNDKYVKNYPSADIFEKLAISDEERSKSGTIEHMAGYVFTCHELQANIMAQFVRQHYSVIHNDLYNYLSKNKFGEFDKVARMRCDDHVVVAMYGERSSWEKVMSNRSGWFAFMDHDGAGGWSSIVESYVKDMTPEEFMKFTRNKNGDDPYKYEDAVPKVYRLHPNLPNPFLIEDPSIVQMRIDQYNNGEVSAVMKKWVEMVDAGVINDNPDNELRKIFWKCYDNNLIYNAEDGKYYTPEDYKKDVNPDFNN